MDAGDHNARYGGSAGCRLCSGLQRVGPCQVSVDTTPFRMSKHSLPMLPHSVVAHAQYCGGLFQGIAPQGLPYYQFLSVYLLERVHQHFMAAMLAKEGALKRQFFVHQAWRLTAGSMTNCWMSSAVQKRAPRLWPSVPSTQSLSWSNSIPCLRSTRQRIGVCPSTMACASSTPSVWASCLEPYSGDLGELLLLLYIRLVTQRLCMGRPLPCIMGSNGCMACYILVWVHFLSFCGSLSLDEAMQLSHAASVQVLGWKGLYRSFSKTTIDSST